MKAAIGVFALAAGLLPFPAHADWKPVEKVVPYTITGTTGIALYRSIGERGPKLGSGRAIAFTDFKLTWQRDYRPTSDGGCTLAAARPSLTILYRLPQPAGTLPPALRQRWETFIAGIRAHEHTHGAMIVDMVKKLEVASVGLAVANDPRCRKIRDALVEPFRAISDARVARSRAFDREEMKDGGNVHKLVLDLVNGD